MNRKMSFLLLLWLVLFSSACSKNSSDEDVMLNQSTLRSDVKKDDIVDKSIFDENEELDSVLDQKKERMDWIDGELYYINSDGNIDRTSKWRKINDKWYFISSKGYAVRNSWEGTYYLLNNGQMATNQYIDRFYVGEDGAWETNNWLENNWKVEGKWYNDDDIWLFVESTGNTQIIDVTEIRSINRLGYNTSTENGMPQQSIVAYKAALDHGFNILLCDLRFSGRWSSGLLS